MKKNQKLLTQKELTKALVPFPGWKLDAKHTKCSRIFEFEKHIDALIFIARSTVNAEVVQHHPDITFTHAKVKMVLTSHDTGGITKKDIELLERIEMVFAGQTRG